MSQASGRYKLNRGRDSADKRLHRGVHKRNNESDPAGVRRRARSLCNTTRRVIPIFCPCSLRGLNFEIRCGNARVTETRWVGEEEPSTNCGASEGRSKLIECLQNDRRVEIEMVYLNEEQHHQIQP